MVICNYSLFHCVMSTNCPVTSGGIVTVFNTLRYGLFWWNRTAWCRSILQNVANLQRSKITIIRRALEKNWNDTIWYKLSIRDGHLNWYNRKRCPVYRDFQPISVMAAQWNSTGVGQSGGVIWCRWRSGTGVWVRDVHTEMVRAEFMWGNFVVYRLNINTL